MKVSDLAKEYNTTTDFILETIKSFKLKAKDADQELNAVVLSVVRGHLNSLDKRKIPFPGQKLARISPQVLETIMKGQPNLDEEEAPVKKPARKRVVKKTDGEPISVVAVPVVEEPKAAAKRVSKNISEDSSIEKVTPGITAVKVEAKPEIVPIIKQEPKPEIKPEVKLDAQAKKKPAISIGDEPLITLTPLSRKKKRPVGSKEADDAAAARAFLTDEEHSAAKPVVPLAASAEGAKELVGVEMKVPITVKDLSTRIGQKSSAILKILMDMGLFCHINQSLDKDVAETVIQKFGFKLIEIKTEEEQLILFHEETDDPSLLKLRAPVVTLMGHVDHGKTSLLDSIRKSNVTDSEHGGITQHMRAYSVKTPRGMVTFLDTPGHEAFTAMRSRGAHITDIAIIVIAADEGIMPQTLEAIDHAKAANVPIVIALNKMDKSTVDPDRVKKQLSDIGFMPEEWGGKTIVVPVSAKTGAGIDQLLEMMLLEAELLELKANPDRHASGIVVEAHLSQGRGSLATLIVQNGTLKEGDYIVVGPYYGKVKAMVDDYNRPVKSAGPATPVEVLGLPEVPSAGEKFYVVEDDRKAKEIASQRQEQIKKERLNAQQRVTLETLYAHLKAGEMKELNVILKGDVQGSVEALKDSLMKLPSDKVRINFIHAGVGVVNTSDVVLAQASSAIIIAFNVGIDSRARAEMEHLAVEVREYRIIYDAVQDMHNALEGMLEAKTVKNFLARIEVREVFKLSKHGIVAGCYVLKGKAPRKAKIDVMRNGECVFSGSISSLKRFKDDVKEVTESMECGLTINGFDKYEVGDILEIYDEQKVAQRL
ncbi:MAG: translation initiation factor IF-2 [Candidatus Omnitrophica bacterium]|nr:translation initiation factor IF-2 [Candidatus Omnitrophota bacterium]